MKTSWYLNYMVNQKKVHTCGLNPVFDLIKTFVEIESCHKSDFFFLRKDLFSCMRAQHILNYHLIQISWTERCKKFLIKKSCKSNWLDTIFFIFLGQIGLYQRCQWGKTVRTGCLREYLYYKVKVPRWTKTKRPNVGITTSRQPTCKDR